MVKWLEVQNLRHKNPRLSVTAAATEVSARGGISVSSLRSAYKTIEGYRRTRPAFRRKFDGYVRLLFSM